MAFDRAGGHKAILITRPREQAAAYAQELEGEGFATQSAPLLEFYPLAFDIPDLMLFEGLVFTSAQALRVFGCPEAAQNLTLYVVGEATAAAARSLGYSDVIEGDSDGRALAALIEESCGGGPLRLLYVRGREVSYPLAEDLRGRGCVVDEVSVYGARQIDAFDAAVMDAIKNEHLQAVTFFSKRTADAFVAAIELAGLEASLGAIKALCISDGVLRCVRDLKWQSTHVAHTPNRVGMRALVEKLCASEQ